MVEIFCFEFRLFDNLVWATLYNITENRNWLAKVFDVDATKFLCISVSRHVQTTWRRRRREEEREYSIFSTFLLWKHTFDRFTITNGYAHLSLFTYVLDKIKTEFETNHHADCNICRVNIPTSHLSLLENAPLLGYIIQKRMTVYWNIFTSIDDLAHYIIGVAFIFTTTRNINTIPVIHSPVCLSLLFFAGMACQ